MKNASQHLKSLEVALNAAEAAHFKAKDTLRLAAREENAALTEVQRLKREIADLKKREGEIIITEHALVRFFERVLGYDLKKVQEDLIPDIYRERAKGKFYTEMVVENSHRVVVRDGRVITVNPIQVDPPKIRQIKDSDTDGDFTEIDVADEDAESGGRAAL